MQQKNSIELALYQGMTSVVPTTIRVRFPGFSPCRSGGSIGHRADEVSRPADQAAFTGCGSVHAQLIENFWSLLNRALRRPYAAVEPFHLDAYGGDRFMLAVSQISGKTLTYAELTGKVGGGRVRTRSNVPHWAKRQNRGKRV
jgi:hypothetical protein